MSKFKQHASLPVNFEGLINARCPQDVFTFFDDFMGCSWAIDADTLSITTTTGSNIWTYTVVGAAEHSVACVDATYGAKSTLGGIIRLTTSTTINGGHNLQVAGQAFLIDQDCGLPLYFETRFRSSDMGNTDFFIGLADVDVEIVATGPDDACGFVVEDEVLNVICAETSKEKVVATGVTLADGAATSDTGWIRAAFYFDGKNTVSFFTDGDDDGEFDFVTSLNVGTTMDYLPDIGTLTPSIEAITGATNTAGVLDIDYVFCTQQRYHA